MGAELIGGDRPHPMRLATRVAVGILALVVLGAAIGGYYLVLIQRLHAQNRHLADIELQIAQSGLQLRALLAQLDEFTRKLLVLRDPEYALQLRELRLDLAQELAQLSSRSLDPDLHDAVAELELKARLYLSVADQAEADILDGGASHGGEDYELLPLLATVGRLLTRLQAETRSSTERQIIASTHSARRALATAWAAAAVAALFALLVTIGVTRAVRQPLEALARGTHEIALGHFQHRVPVDGPAELSNLATDFNSMADRLGELDRLKRDFVAAVSHDLKAPLASMEETNRLLLDGPLGALNEKQERLLRLNLQCGARLSSMIQDLLDLARLEGGTLALESERIELGELTSNALADAESLIRSRRLSLETDLPDGEVVVLGDRALIWQALWNLLSNAIKFTPDGGELGLRVQRFASSRALRQRYRRAPGELPAPAAVLEVWDSGPGVPDDEKELIFQRFYRATRGVRGIQGTGLGLAIARAVMSQHGGCLWVEDRAHGGSRFVLALGADGSEPAQAVADPRQESVGAAAPT